MTALQRVPSTFDQTGRSSVALAPSTHVGVLGVESDTSAPRRVEGAEDCMSSAVMDGMRAPPIHEGADRVGRVPRCSIGRGAPSGEI